MAQTIVTLSGDDAELYKAFQRILDQQAKTEGGYKKIAGASKEAAAAAKAAAKEQAEDEKRRVDAIDKTIGTVAGLVTTYVSVTAAVSALTKAHAELIDNQDKALGKAKELAAAQQEAAKNLAGKTPEQISQTLQRTVPEIAKETQFSDLAKLTTALGSAASIVGEDKATGVVSAAAQLTRFTPEALGTTATATADIMAATGLGDAKEALALLASTGSVARPEDLSKLAQGAAAAVNAAIAQAPAQDKVDAAREGVALYAKLTAVDPSGQSAATATTDFIRQVSALFADPKLVKERNERIETLKLGTTDNALAVQSAQMKIADTQRTAEFFKPTDQSPEAETARLQLAKARQDLAQAELKAKRDADELRRLQVIDTATKAETPEQFEQRKQANQREIDELSSGIARGEANIKGWTEVIEKNPGSDAAKTFGRVRDQIQERIEKDSVRIGELKSERETMQPVTTDTFKQRLQVIQRTPELRGALQETLTGEAKFQPLFRQLLDGESKLTAGFNEALSTVTTDVSAFETVAATTVQTPQARVVEAANLAETALNIQQSTDTEGQVRAAVGKIFADAMGATSVDMLTGLGSVGTRLTSPLGRTLDGPTGFGDSQIKELQNRIEYLQNANAPPAQIETAGAAIEAINKLLVLPERLEALKTNGDNVGAYLERQNKLMERTNELLEQSLNNQPSNAPNRLREMLRPEGQP
jgi:hypothetical protein